LKGGGKRFPNKKWKGYLIGERANGRLSAEEGVQKRRGCGQQGKKSHALRLKKRTRERLGGGGTFTSGECLAAGGGQAI